MRRTLLLLLWAVVAAPALEPTGLDAYDFRYLPILRTGTAHLASSADPTGGNDDRGHYRAREARRAVLMESQGPGQITRIWSANPQGRLLIWIDDETTPRLDLPFAELGRVGDQTPRVDGFVSEAGGGVSCWFPIGFERWCRVAVEGAEQLYYQVNYTTYPPGTPLKSFAPGPFEQPSGFEYGVSLPADGTIKPGGTLKLFETTGAKTIRRLGLSFSRADGSKAPPSLEALRGLRLRLRWDDAPGYSVDVPLLDLCASGLGPAQLLSAPVAVADWSFVTFDFPMPFARRAVGELHQAGGVPLKVAADCYVTGGRRADDGYFHAEYRQSTTVAGKPHRLADIRGRGHYVGAAVTLRGAGGDLTYLEGDETITVDGGERLQGTGTEDWFDGAWFFRRGPYAQPFAGAPVLLAGKTRLTAYRWQVADCVPFRRSLTVDLEHGPGNDSPGCVYRSVACWYAAAPTAVVKPPVPPRPEPYTEAIPGGLLVEAETAAGSPAGDGALPLPASGGQVARFRPKDPADPLRLPFAVRDDNLYALRLRLLTTGMGLTARYQLDDGPVTDVVTAALVPGPDLLLGRERLTAGDHVLLIWLEPPPGAPRGADVDLLALEPVGKVKGALEAERLAAAADGDSAALVTQTHDELPAGARRDASVVGGAVPVDAVWSGGAQRRFTPSAAGDGCTLTVEVPDAGDWSLALGLSRGRDYGACVVTVGGRTIVPMLDCFQADVPESVGWRVPLGTHRLPAGPLDIRLIGVAREGKVRPIGIDYLLLEPAMRGHEAESLAPAGQPTGIVKERFGAEPRWSGGAYVRFVGEAELQLFAPRAGRYALSLQRVLLPTGGTVEILLGGRTLGSFDGAADSERPAPAEGFEVTLQRGANRLRLVPSGGDAALDVITLEFLGAGIPWMPIGVCLAAAAGVLYSRKRGKSR